MRLEVSRNTMTGDISFKGEVSVHDLATLRLDHIDRQVISSDAVTAADMLQSLEIIFRRHGEQQTY
jgi:hypothetical protein